MIFQTVLQSLCVVLVLCFTSSLRSSEPIDEHMAAQSKNPGNVRSFSEEEVKELLRQRQQQITKLIAIAQQPNVDTRLTHGGGWSSPQVLAIELLGEFRAEKAVSTLVERITLFVPRPSLETIPAASYPCARALAKIGLPGVKGILKRLDSPATEKEIILFATVVWLVDGDEIGLLRLENALKNATTKNQETLGMLVELYRAKNWYRY